MKNSRYSNYGLWVSIFALIPLLCQGFGVNILSSNYNEIINAILGILVTAGILSNPTSGTGFVDNAEEKVVEK